MIRKGTVLILLVSFLAAACGGGSATTTTQSTSTTAGDSATSSTTGETTTTTAGEPTTSTTGGGTTTTGVPAGNFDACAAGDAYRTLQSLALGEAADPADVAEAASQALTSGLANPPTEFPALSEVAGALATLADGTDAAEIAEVATEVETMASDDWLESAAFLIADGCPDGELAKIGDWEVVPHGTIGALADLLPGLDFELDKLKGRDFELIEGTLVGTAATSRFFVDAGELAATHLVVSAKSDDRVQLSVLIRQGGEFVSDAELRQRTRTRRAPMVFDVTSREESNIMVKPDVAIVYSVRLVTLP